MNKDNSKYDQLHTLGIALYTVENQDLYQPSFRAFVDHLPGLDSRGRKRVTWTRIMLSMGLPL
jgi:hypothetical protein